LEGLPATTRYLAQLPEARGDAKIVEALKAGRPGAAKGFFDRYESEVKKVLDQMLAGDPAIHDVLQNVFVRLLGELTRTLNQHIPFADWVRRVTIIEAREHLRAVRTHQRVLQQVRWACLVRTVNEERNAEAIDALRRVNHVMGCLPTEERDAFDLRIVRGVRVKDMAKILGVSVATVKRRVGSARQRFGRQARSDPSLREWMEDGTRWGEASASDPGIKSPGNEIAIVEGKTGDLDAL
jgi:RNA polymerase sigma-70 factor (ECF subfamily)